MRKVWNKGHRIKVNLKMYNFDHLRMYNFKLTFIKYK